MVVTVAKRAKTSRVRLWAARAKRALHAAAQRARRCFGLVRHGAKSAGKQLAREEEGQGTTEYALIVGVLVVVAISALSSIREKVQGLWDGITGAMGAL